ncbi:MAG TPA: hypothetical protein VFK92_00790 [Burkholderiales bacterium]|nr:hypothetical protein [Burkholderiales bacterium]
MSLGQTLKRELRVVLLTTLYFAAWFVLLMVVKKLVLEEYQIEVRGVSLALVGALIVAKVVLVLEHVSLGEWVGRHPAAVGVALRTLLYGIGVLLMLLLEKAFESRDEAGGFWPALLHVFQHRDMPHVWANTIVVVFALFAYNVLAVLRRLLGAESLVRSFLARPAGR